MSLASLEKAFRGRTTIDGRNACPFSVFINNASERGEARLQLNAMLQSQHSLCPFSPFQCGVLFLPCECAKFRHSSIRLSLSRSLHAFPRTHVLGNTSW